MKIKRGEKNKNRKQKHEPESKKENKAGYTAQDAPSMRTFHLRK